MDSNKWLAMVFIGFIIMVVSLALFLPGRKSESMDGMSVYVDHLTGCQYLGSGKGWGGPKALTPRLDVGGRQICNKPGG